MHLPVVFVGPSGIGEQPVDGRIDLLAARLRALHRIQTCCEFIPARRKVLGNVVQNLRPQMAGGFRPALRRMCRLDRIAQVLAVGEAHMPQKPAGLAPDRRGIAAIGPRLFATDIKLRGAVDPLLRRALT